MKKSWLPASFLQGASGDAVRLMAVRMMTILLSFGVTRLLSEHLSLQDYGSYRQALLVVSTLSSAAILGMVDGVNFFHHTQPQGERERYLATLFVLQGVIGAACGLLAMVFSGALCRYFENPDVRRLLIFGAALPVLQNLLSMLQILLVSVGRAKLLAVRNLAVALVRLAVVLLVIGMVKDVAVILAATLLLDGAQLLLFAHILKKNGHITSLKKADFRLVKMIFGYCAPMACFTMLNALNRDLDQYLIALWTDTATLALYANASKALPFDIIMTSFSTVLQPKITGQMAEGHYETAAVFYRRFLELVYTATGILCCAALAAAPQLMQLLYSSKYSAGTDVFKVYILVDLLRFANLTMILSAAGRTKKLVCIGILALAVNGGLNWLLFRPLGLLGPAVATLLVTGLTGSLILCFGAKELHTGIGKLFDKKRLAVFFMQSLLALWVFSLLRKWLETLRMQSILIVLAVSSGYCVVMILLQGKRLLKILRQLNDLPKHDE